MPRVCTALLDEGRRCDNRALPYGNVCSAHLPEGAMHLRPCRYFNRSGHPCRAQAIRGQEHCFTHSPRNRRAKQEPVPLVPRTRRQMQRAKWLIFSNLALCRRTALEAPQNQLPGTVPLYRPVGSPVYSEVNTDD